jgi:hypothetical protein
MQPRPPPFDPRALDAFVALAGPRTWSARIREIHRLAASGPRAGLATRQRHAIELAIERLRGPLQRPASTPELHAARLAGEAVALASRLTPHGRTRLSERLRADLGSDGTLMSLFHLLRTSALQRGRGFQVHFAGFEEDASYDLLLVSGMVEAEVVCDIVSAEEGRLVHRSAWSRLADRMDEDLQAWLTRHPGHYLLKMTLPLGLQGGLHEQTADGGPLASLHIRIRRMLETKGRGDHDEGLVLRLDPLVLHGGQSGQPALWSSLRQQFGPEAHLSVTTAGDGVFVMAARAGRENKVGTALRRRLGVIAPARLTGTRPGILAMFVEDTDRVEWRGLRERLELEGEARQFLAHKDARPVIAVTCASRFELFGMSAPHAAEDGELRFRNPAHPAARATALAPAVLSSV